MTLFEYIESRRDELLLAAAEHAFVVALCILIATIIGVGVGIAAYRRPRLAAFAIGTSGVFLTIPSFALLGLLIPLLGLGWGPTVVALVLYSLLPIVRNTIVGLNGVDGAVVEAGRGMGMSARRVMARVQLPLAWPVILTGIRVSTQMIIGIAAIAAYVAGPGLGNQLFDGLARLGSVNSLNAALAGTLGVILLALAFDLLYLVIRLVTTPGGLRA